MFSNLQRSILIPLPNTAFLQFVVDGFHEFLPQQLFLQFMDGFYEFVGREIRKANFILLCCCAVFQYLESSALDFIMTCPKIILKDLMLDRCSTLLLIRVTFLSTRTFLRHASREARLSNSMEHLINCMKDFRFCSRESLMLYGSTV